MCFVIAVDGPSGAGKSTVARKVALTLNLDYLDTGAMYRAVALRSAECGADASDAAAIAELASQLRIGFSPLTPDGKQRVSVDDEDVTAAIRTPEISELTSVIAAIPGVRSAIVAQQRVLARSASHGAVLEGRDIGTVVLPDAALKIFLTASPEERARRRCAELLANGTAAEYDSVLSAQRIRDARDSSRAASPLIAAPDAVAVNTDGLSAEHVASQIVELAQQRLQRSR